MLKQFGLDPTIGAIGDWNCKVRTLVGGKRHAQTFTMTLTEDRNATLISERLHKEPGMVIKYEQTSVGVWKTGGMRFGFDNLKHSIELIKTSGRTMRAMSEGQHASFTRQLLRESLKPTEKIRYDITLIDKDRFRLIEGGADVEDEGAVKTNCTRQKELTEEQLAKIEAKAKAREEGVQDTKSALFN